MKFLENSELYKLHCQATFFFFFFLRENQSPQGTCSIEIRNFSLDLFFTAAKVHHRISHPSSGENHGWTLLISSSPHGQGTVFWRLSREGSNLPWGTSCRSRRRLPVWEERSVSMPSCPLDPEHFIVLHTGHCPAQTWWSQVNTATHPHSPS